MTVLAARRPSSWLLSVAAGAGLVLGLGACAGDDDDTGPIDTGSAPECLEDDACGDNEICEEQVCIVGDRDDTFEDAGPLLKVQDLDDPNVKTGLIHTPGDVDHYVYTNLEPEWVRISTITDGGDDGLDTVLSVFAADGSLHHVMDEYATGSLSSYDSRMQVYLPVAGDWYIRVEDRSTFYGDEPRGNTGFRYRLGLEGWGSVTAEPDTMEDPSIRYPMESGSVIYPWGINIEEDGDIDFAEATMPFGDAPFEIWAPEVIPGSDMVPRVEVTDPDGFLHLSLTDVGARGFASTFSSPETTFTVSASDADGAFGPNTWTVLYLRTRPEGYGNPREVEPNDTVADATPLDAEEVTEGGVTSDRHFLQGKLLTEGDQDHYRFAAREGGRLRLVCSSDSYGATGDVTVDVLDPSGAAVATFEDGDDSAPDGELEDLQEGAYTLLFSAADGSSGPSVYYRCGVYADHP